MSPTKKLEQSDGYDIVQPKSNDDTIAMQAKALEQLISSLEQSTAQVVELSERTFM